MWARGLGVEGACRRPPAASLRGSLRLSQTRYTPSWTCTFLLLCRRFAAALRPCAGGVYTCYRVRVRGTKVFFLPASMAHAKISVVLEIVRS